MKSTRLGDILPPEGVRDVEVVIGEHGGSRDYFDVHQPLREVLSKYEPQWRERGFVDLDYLTLVVAVGCGFKSPF